MNLSRLISLIGSDNVKKIKNLNILVLGLGGVGGYTVESLIRSGVERITLVDGDVLEESNINRQLICNRLNINKYKTKVTYRRIKSINKDVSITIINKMIKEEDINLLFMQEYDYVVDACDTVLIKQVLIRECYKRNIKIISCMGTAKRIDATLLYIDSLDNVTSDPLAKSVIKGLSNDEIKHTIVVSSKEKAISTPHLGSTSYVPGVAGLYITNYIINDIIKS
ncbi:MAG: ThiF family adenylyltransferase [Bacilli bacterium]